MSMKGLFKSFFNNDEKKETRILDHPRDLNKGDIVKFHLMPQPELSNKEFQVTDVNTYDFEDRKLTELTLKGGSQASVYLTVDETDDEPFLSFSRKINRNIVEQIFSMDEFANIFDTEEPATLNRISEPEDLQNWTTDKYLQEIYAEGGYFHKGDYRKNPVPNNENEGDDFEYYMLIGNKRQFMIEAEVYDGGETDIIISIRRPLSDIEEMFPA
ncbi:MAG: hypothetical protein OEM38_03370 [Gammaproteobacteria bacterium]|nr:hypothetical protein [Gammaproteobacteria bacterium]